VTKGINWEETIKKWKPSEGDCEPIDKASPIISGVCDVMKQCLMKEKDSMVELLGLRTKQDVSKDSLSKWELLDLGSAQLNEHKNAWKTHIKKDSTTNNMTVEFPVVVSKVPHLRYFKIIIKDGKTKVFDPKNVKQVFLDYHQAKDSIEVIYV
jgi:hypothetical protein